MAMSIAVATKPDIEAPEMTIQINPDTNDVRITATDIRRSDWCAALQQAIDRYCEQETL